MPLAKSLSHRTVGSTNIPYVSNNSPTSTQVLFASGSSDILTQVTGWAQRRPGFSDDVETTPSVFNNLQRLFTWERFDGSIYIMACDINNLDEAVVYKYLVGSDVSFQAILTDTINTGIPYDFVSSNNTVYFSNGFTNKKWDPINGLSNWGIAIGSRSGSSSKYAGTGTNVNLSGDVWANPSNVTGAPDATYAVSTISVSGTTTDILEATNYGFAIPVGATIAGIQVSPTSHADIAGASVTVGLIYLGNQVGNTKTLIEDISDSTEALGGSSDLWGASLSPSIVNSSSFGVYVYGLGDGTFSMDAIQVTVYYTSAPVIAVSASAGTMSATTGYQYVYTYGNSNTGHISSPTPPSLSTGTFANKLKVSVTITASTDPQVNQIHLYRTTDSATGLGGQTYFELPNSPFANSTATVDDAATDTQLNIYSIAPTPTFNDPPPLWQGMQYYSGRIWGYIGNKVWFTGLEEIINGVPEESVPSGVAGNFYAFDQPVQAIGVAGIDENQKLLVFCPGRIYSIQGTTLDTFRRRRIADRRGCRNRTCVTMMGGVCAWLDTASQVWATDGTQIEELSIPIRPDLIGINQTISSMAFHVSGNAHWLLLSNGEVLYVYDVDSEQWMPPWSFSCQYIYSGETQPGTYSLMAAKPTKAIKMNPTSFNDDGATYSPVTVTNLFSTVPDTPGVSDDPSRTGAPWFVEVDTNNFTLTDVGYLVDDDTDTGTYSSLTRDKSAVAMTFNREEKTNIRQQIYPMAGRPACRWMGIKITMPSADRLDILYGWDLAYTVFK